MSDEISKAAAHWNSKVGAAALPSRNTIRFWQSAQTVKHINKKVCGRPVGGYNQGIVLQLKEMLKGRKLGLGVSVGCGTGGKEMTLIEAGIVAEFDLYEIAVARIAVGQELAAKRGLSDQTNFFLGDAFAVEPEPLYDLVYWDGSLHHMLDVPAAVAWSKKVLKPNGWIVVNEYVGASRFQFSQRNLDYATKIRRALPRRFLENGAKPGSFVPEVVKNPDPERVIAMDPTESADSARILSSVQDVFPDGRWIMLGGAIYHVGLNDLFWNFERYEDGDKLLDQCLVADDALAELGEIHYAVFFGQT